MLHEPPFGYHSGSERPDDHTGYEPMDFNVPALAGPLEPSFDAHPEPPQAEEPAQLRQRIEDAAHAANALQSALFDLEAELLRLQHIVRRASPAMMQLMQAATEVRAAGLADQR
jgi:hypothetical protein